MLHEYRKEISKLKETDAHFAKIFDLHNALDEKIAKMQAGIELATEEKIQELKKEKLRLKDEIFVMLQRLNA